MPEPDRILSEFIDAWNAGERPDVDAYLDRAAPGEQAGLAEAITTFLLTAPSPVYSDAVLDEVAADPLVQDALAAVGAPGGLWPALLPRLRARLALSLDGLAAAFTEAVGLRGREEKARGYLADLENGRLDPAGLTGRALDALAQVLRVPRAELEGAGGMTFASPALFRADTPVAEAAAADLDLLADALATPADAGWDEVDELFRAGR
jgi:hypothetical protein